MDATLIFSQALGLAEPWYIKSVSFSPDEASSSSQILSIDIGIKSGSRFEYKGKEYAVYDHQSRRWRHLNFFQHTCYLSCDVPRIQTDDGHTLLVEVPWSRPGSSFTLLFEAYSLLLIQSGMNLSAAGRLLAIDPRRLNRMVGHYVEQALVDTPLSEITQVGIDETSVQKGHKYVTVLTDPLEKRVIGLGLGKDTHAVGLATKQMENRGADPLAVELASIDLSKAYISATSRYFPNAEIVFDRFHIQKLLNQAVDQVRREDQKQNKALKRSRYLWLRNNADLNQEKKQTIAFLQSLCPRIGLAYRLKEQFREIWNETITKDAIMQLDAWIEVAWNTQIDHLQKFVNTLKKHWYGILTYFKSRQTNAFAERANLTIQEIKRAAKGYRNMENFFNIVYLHLGKLNLNLPTING